MMADRAGISIANSETRQSQPGHLADAISFEQAALRHRCLEVDPAGAAISRLHLAPTWERMAMTRPRHWPTSWPVDSWCTRRARGLEINPRGGSEGPAVARRRPPIPASFTALRGLVDQVEGVRFAELFGRLTGPVPTAITPLLRCWSWPTSPSRTQAAEERLLGAWMPMAEAAVAAARSNTNARDALERLPVSWTPAPTGPALAGCCAASWPGNAAKGSWRAWTKLPPSSFRRSRSECGPRASDAAFAVDRRSSVSRHRGG
jgi:hypothetical protein